MTNWLRLSPVLTLPQSNVPDVSNSPSPASTLQKPQRVTYPQQYHWLLKHYALERMHHSFVKPASWSKTHTPLFKGVHSQDHILWFKDRLARERDIAKKKPTL